MQYHSVSTFLVTPPSDLHGISLPQPPHVQDRLTFPLTFEWKKQGNMPYYATLGDFCIIDEKIYISEYDSFGILEYNPNTDKWVALPTSDSTIVHGVVSLNGKLTLVGRLKKGSTTQRYIIVVQVWDSDSKQWTEPYPPMTNEKVRSRMECASYLHYLIIAVVSESDLLVTVDILDTRSGQWFKAPSPINNTSSDGYWSHTYSAIIGESLYISFLSRNFRNFSIAKNTKYLFRVSLPTLISYTLQGKHHDTSIWERIPNVAHTRTTLFSIGNMLLTAGGDRRGGIASTLSVFFPYIFHEGSADIHLFNPHTKEWLKIGELPEPRISCACTVLPSGKLLVAGGYDDNGRLLTVYTATIAGSYFEPVHF